VDGQISVADTFMVVDFLGKNVKRHTQPKCKNEKSSNPFFFSIETLEN
jgi:hypothetical protein